MRINPVNAPAFGPMTGAAMDLDVMNPLRIAVMVSKYWGPTPRQLTVSFMESTPPDLRARILSHMNEWAKSGCINFVWTQGVGQVRVSRSGGGYWSYLGTDILHIPQDRQTMNLQDFTMNTLESEYRRVIRHETGHTLGFPHEHMRQELIAKIDPNKAYDYFLRTQGWNRAMVDAQVLTPLDQKSILGTPPDQTSIMCYQLPVQSRATEGPSSAARTSTRRTRASRRASIRSRAIKARPPPRMPSTSKPTTGTRVRTCQASDLALT